MRTVLCIVLPRIATDRIARTDRRFRRQPLVLVTETRGTRRVAEISVEAESAGARRGMTLAQARAIAPGLLYLPYRPEDDTRELEAIATILSRYSPIIGIYDAKTLAIDMSGCEALFDNFQTLAKKVVRDILKRGFRVRAVFASTPTAARALALSIKSDSTDSKNNNSDVPSIEPDCELESLARIPPAYLGISPEAEKKLSALGITTIEQLVYLPRGALTARVGAGVLLQIDRALGRVADPIAPFHAIGLPAERIEPPVPVSQWQMVMFLLRRLADGIAAQLEAGMLGARAVECNIGRPEGMKETFTISLSEPRRARAWLFSLLKTRFERIDLGVEIESLELRVTSAEPLQYSEPALFNNLEPAARSDLRGLFDRLSARLGERAVGMIDLKEDYRPEYNYTISAPRMKSPPLSERVRHDLQYSQRVRPLCIYKSPVPVEIKLNETGDPASFIMNGRVHEITRSTGPEAIESGWWDGNHCSRYYWIVECADGARYWIYSSATGESAHLHGVFC
ncbi:MAG: DNA polymerase Y family protein [Planctomycetes bacterium]|nr:DNA polymerase Y family protein [Planctomycetota bacterium]